MEARQVSVAPTAEVWLKKSEMIKSQAGYDGKDKTYKLDSTITHAHTKLTAAGEPDPGSKVEIEATKGEFLKYLERKEGEYRLVRAKLKDGKRQAWWAKRSELGAWKKPEYWVEKDVTSVYDANPELPLFTEDHPHVLETDTVYSPSEVEKVSLFGESWYGIKVDDTEERAWATSRTGEVEPLNPYDWRNFFEVLLDPMQNGYCDVDVLIRKIEKVKGNKQDKLLETKEIRRALRDATTAKYLRRLVINDKTEWSKLVDDQCGKYLKFSQPPYCLHPAVVKAKTTDSFKYFQWWDEVKPEGLNPKSLCFFHPVAFVEHLGRLWQPPLFPLEKGVCTYFRKNFAAPRDGGRYHAGCDLLAPVGAAVRAVSDGTIVAYRNFYWQTYELVVDHGEFIVRYGEVQPPTDNRYGANGPPVEVAKGLPGVLRVGDTVMRGQHIAYVGQLRKMKGGAVVNHHETMLHFEMYQGNGGQEYADLTEEGNAEYLYVPEKKYQRRKDLLDPTGDLEKAFDEL